MMFYFVFFKQKTAYEMRISDWSSDVCSSDLNRRWAGGALTVREILKKGYLGRIVEFESHYDRFRNFIQENTWKEDKKAGTGTLYNLGSHQIDEALFLFGMPDGVWADLRVIDRKSVV